MSHLRDCAPLTNLAVSPALITSSSIVTQRSVNGTLCAPKISRHLSSPEPGTRNMTITSAGTFPACSDSADHALCNRNIHDNREILDSWLCENQLCQSSDLLRCGVHPKFTAVGGFTAVIQDCIENREARSSSANESARVSEVSGRKGGTMTCSGLYVTSRMPA
jgi:hypothetical protein